MVLTQSIILMLQDTNFQISLLKIKYLISYIMLDN